MEISFFKYQGTGNDFVIIDNREGKINLNTQQVKLLCDRRFGVGGDGLMLLNTQSNYDFKMVYFNADGNEGSMCGNGGRCLTQFAFDRGIIKDVYLFIAVDGEHEATMSDGWVNLKMKDVTNIKDRRGSYVLNTGSPHYVETTQDVMEMNVAEEGREIRNSKEFIKEGINVNFVEVVNEQEIIVRTYERGVEDETLSCGTGVTAAAIATSPETLGFNRVQITTLGGKLAVEYDKIDQQTFNNIWLCGPATFVFKGEIKID